MSLSENKSKAVILIVEDEWMFYEDLETFFTSNGYEVLPYTKSYPEAMKIIERTIPDIVLMDIKLQGNLNGIQLAEKLNEKYSFPIIFISDDSTLETFEWVKKAQAKQFFIKGNIHDKKQILYTIELALDEKKVVFPKIGIEAYSKYVKESKDSDRFLLRTIIHFDQILYFKAVKDYLESNEDGEMVQKGKGYQIIYTIQHETFYIKKTLRELEEILPDYFIRISHSEIINGQRISGRINGNKIKVATIDFEIKDAYKESALKKIRELFVS
jgi:two-component system response regulator LytT